MPDRETTLETAAFLDSPQAKALDLPSSDTRTIVSRFLDCAYDGVGKAPRHLDADDLHGILGHLMPGRFGRRDPLAAQVLPVLRSYLAFLEERAIVPQAYELRNSLEENAALFREVVETGKAHVHGHGGRSEGSAPEKPFVHRADKVGRNDPCPCGSGKKFKQCCAKLG